MAFNWKLDKKILIVDDDDNFREYLYTMLSEWGYQVVEAGDGIKAMLRIMEESPDLVLLDLDMPTISGRRVTELINSVPQTRNIPIIVISGRSSGMAMRQMVRSRVRFQVGVANWEAVWASSNLASWKVRDIRD